MTVDIARLQNIFPRRRVERLGHLFLFSDFPGLGIQTLLIGLA